MSRGRPDSSSAAYERLARLKLVPAWAILLLVLAGSGCAAVVALPAEPAVPSYHHVPADELGDASAYWNTAWKGRSGELWREMRAVVSAYSKTHRFTPGETDCNVMAVEIWDRLRSRGIVSIIVAGSLEMTQEGFGDCDHAWLMVYSAEGSAVALETTNGRTYTWVDTRADGRLRQYWEGFAYDNPSSLWADFSERW